MNEPKTEAGWAHTHKLGRPRVDGISTCYLCGQRFIEAEAVKPWREALSAAMTHYEGSLAECGCEVATRARALLDEAGK